MKKLINVALISIMLILTACGDKKTSTITSNSTSKSVGQVMQEKISDEQKTDNKNHGGSVVDPNDKSNKTSSLPKPVLSGGSSQINGGSNLKRESSNSGRVLNASDIDLDLTSLNSNMVYAEVYNMMNSPDNYVGKMVRMKGYMSVIKYPERNYYTCIIPDASQCCQQGMEFELAGNKKYPDDYPNEGDGIIVTGVFDIYYEGDSKYVQLKNASLLKSRT